MDTLKLTYFGAFQIEVNGQTIPNFRTEKTAALLAYLALEGQTPLPRLHLTDLLWHGYEKNAAQTSLRVALTYLRQILDPIQPIKSTHKQIQFDSAGVHIQSDAHALTAVETAGLQPVSHRQLSQTLTLYRGEFLEGWELVDSAPFQLWLQKRRAYYRNLTVNIRKKLAPAVNIVPTPRQHNLPRRRTPLFGHTTALTQLHTLLLGPHALITLIGEGGVGKTRLALAAASLLLEATADGQSQPFADGLWFVPLNDLNPTADLPDQLATAIGIACGCSFTATSPLTTQLYAWLRTKSLLLILDSFEHLNAASTWLTGILQMAPEVKLLVTSRQRLNLQVATVFPVHELVIPATDLPLTVDELLTYPSVQLFMERSQRVRPDFHLHDDNVADVAQICRRMAGLPLGIELAATLLLLYSPAQIAAQLAVNALVVRAEWLDWPTRHQSIDEVLDASWRLLSAAEARLLAQLAVIKGEFTLTAATTIGDAQPATLFALVDKSLLRQIVDEGLFTMHDLVREYALHQLQQQPMLKITAYSRHATYYLALVAEEEGALPNTWAAQQRLLANVDNVRAAWYWSVEQGELTLWVKASAGLICFYRMVGFSQEAIAALQAAATVLRSHLASGAGTAPDQALLARLLTGVAEFSPYSEREPFLTEALLWSERSGDAESRSLIYYEMSILARVRGSFQAMFTYAQQAHQWAQQSGQPEHELAALHALGMAYYFQHDVTAILAIVNELQAKLTQTPHRQIESLLLSNLGHLYTDLNDYGQALRYLRQAFMVQWQLNPTDVYTIRIRLGKLHVEVGLFDSAQQLYHQSLAYFEQNSSIYFQVLIYQELGALHNMNGDFTAARERLNAALRLARAHNMPYFEHISLIDLGYTQASLGDPQATTYFEEAIRTADPQQFYSTISRAYLGLAQLALRKHEHAQAATIVEQALTHWHKGRTTRAEPRRFYWHCYEVLQALGDPRAHIILQQGYTNLIETADTLTDPFLRRSFLENVPINRALLSAAQGAHKRETV